MGSFTMQYRQRLDESERRFEALTDQMADPAVINDSMQYRKVAKSQNERYPRSVAKYREWKETHRNLEDARLMLNESPIPNCEPWLRKEVAKLEPQLARFEAEAEASAAAQGSQRRKKRRARNPRRHGR